MADENTEGTVVPIPEPEKVLDPVNETPDEKDPVNPLDGKQPEGDIKTESTDGPDLSWLPEDLRVHERLKDFESPEALARAFANAELVQALPEAYQLPEGQPEALGNWAKENKFSQVQLDSMLALKDGVAKYEQDSQARVFAAGRAQLFQSWGEKKDENMHIAESVFSSIESGPELAKIIQASGQGANPLVIKALHEIGSHLKEGGFIKNADVSGEKKANPLESRYPTMFKKPSEE